MIQQLRRHQQRIHSVVTRITYDWSLQFVLWLIWTFTVAGTAYLSWHHDSVAHQPVSIVGIVIHCAFVGIIGLIVITYIEMRIQPWKFYDQ